MARDYATLQTDIAKWLIGDDLTAEIPTFIELAEDRHTWGVVGVDGVNRTGEGAIRVRAMEKRARAVGENSPYLPFPAQFGFLEHRSLQYVGNTRREIELQYAGKESLEFVTDNRPTRYTIQREEFAFNGNLASGLEVELIYYAPFPRLTATTTSNWLLENVYGAYLFGALCEANFYTHDDERQILWEGKYAQIVNGLMASESRARRSQGKRAVKLRNRGVA